MFCFSGPNLVILAWTVDELSLGQAHDWRTHRHTDTQTHAGNDNTRRPKLASGKNQTLLVIILCIRVIEQLHWVTIDINLDYGWTFIYCVMHFYNDIHWQFLKNKNDLRHIIWDGTISIILVLSQTMRYDITMWHHLSLAEPIHRIIPTLPSWLCERWVNSLDPGENSFWNAPMPFVAVIQIPRPELRHPLSRELRWYW